MLLNKDLESFIKQDHLDFQITANFLPKIDIEAIQRELVAKFDFISSVALSNH